jgi:hypothetical protein
VYDVAPGAGVGKLAAMVGPPDSRLKASCTIPLLPAAAQAGKWSGRSVKYTQFGQLDEESECTDGETFVTSHEYDGYGRPGALKYPAVKGSRLTVEYHYTDMGFLQYLSDRLDGSIYWAASEMNALGQVTREITKNGVETTWQRNSSVGWLLGSTSTAHADGNKVIQKWGYGFDEAGNLLKRSRADALIVPGTEETFTSGSYSWRRGEFAVAGLLRPAVSSWVLFSWCHEKAHNPIAEILVALGLRRKCLCRPDAAVSSGHHNAWQIEHDWRALGARDRRQSGRTGQGSWDLGWGADSLAFVRLLEDHRLDGPALAVAEGDGRVHC